MGKISKILILGKTPPPIGGVTVHVQRLLNKIPIDIADFYEISTYSLLTLLYKVVCYRVVHLHVSNPTFLLFLVLWGNVVGSKMVVTIHGNVGRYNSCYKNWCVRTAIRCSAVPIVLNKDSFKTAYKLNINCRLIPAFIEPTIEEFCIDEKTLSQIENLKKRTSLLFCTNAFRYALDDGGREIYGILSLIDYCRGRGDFGLIISDPSSTYQEFLRNKGITLPFNILLISHPHPFLGILKASDAFIRNTITDGDSLSLKEAIFLSKPTFATNVVNRPQGCVVYEREKVACLLDMMTPTTLQTHAPYHELLCGSKEIKELYASYL